MGIQNYDICETYSRGCVGTLNVNRTTVGREVRVENCVWNFHLEIGGFLEVNKNGPTERIRFEIQRHCVFKKQWIFDNDRYFANRSNIESTTFRSIGLRYLNVVHDEIVLGVEVSASSLRENTHHEWFLNITIHESTRGINHLDGSG